MLIKGKPVSYAVIKRQWKDGDTVTLALAATDVSGLTPTYSASGLPTGLTIDTTSGVISGTIDSAADASAPYAVTVTACPVMALPVGFTKAGLPVGIQVIGKPRGEAALFSISSYLESLFGVAKMTPIDPR